MTSRELVKKTLEFKNDTGIIPRECGTLPWTFIHYPQDMEYIQKNFPNDIGRTVAILKDKLPTKGEQFGAGTYVDEWGATFENLCDGIIGEVKTPLIDDEDWDTADRVHIPEELLSFDIEQVNKVCKNSDQYMLSGTMVRPFEQLQFLRGTENLYVDLMLKPPKMMEFIEKMHDFYCRWLTKWAQTDVDGLVMLDDWGSQRSLLINPSIWREVFGPMYKDYIDIAHSHGKTMFMHSDGYITEIFPDLIEMGLDAINSQIFCMPMDELKKYKGKITFWGELDRQDLLVNGTFEDIDNAVKSVYDNLWQSGGCIAQLEFGPGANPENVKRAFEAWKNIAK